MKKEKETSKKIKKHINRKTIRKFSTGATRNPDDNKYDYEGFLSPIVLERFAQHMQENAIQEDGNKRSSDNWQKGIPKDVYVKSALRHFISFWKAHRGYQDEDIQRSACAIMFNIMGYLHEDIKDKNKLKKYE